MPLILALELSTPACSLAVLDGENVLAETAWTQTRSNPPEFFPRLRALARQINLPFSRFDAFAVGLGPGVFSGLRVSLTAARSLALPGRCPVAGIASSRALAARLRLEFPGKTIAVLGDARRETIWLASYPPGDNRPADTSDSFRLARPAELAALVSEDSVVATADWDRIGSLLEAGLASRCHLVRRPVFPAAPDVGRLLLSVLATTAPAIASPPLSPIYLHPPVDPLGGSCSVLAGRQNHGNLRRGVPP